ncbi:MAG: alpha-mannosidase [bacterium]
MTNKKIKAIMVSKTHWDREHSRPFEQFRWHLVYNVMDKLLDIFENVPEYKSFMFDGQSLGILDYLDIRSEREADIKKYAKEGKLIIGPFFVGPDELIPSSESLIRNLYHGHKIAQRFGNVMKIGYNPDAFGHISQLPQILQGFSIGSAVFSRGVSDDIGKPGTDFIWEAPDGSAIIAVYNHYGNCAGLSTDPESALSRITGAISSMMPKDIPCVLLSNGSDGSAPEPHVPKIIEYANEKLEDIEIVHGTLQQYIDLVSQYKDKLKRYRGELRSGRYNLVLPGVYSSRIYLKQENVKTQTLLEKYAEPLSAFAWAVVSDDYPHPFFDRAWRLLLQNHFHDTIYGCSQDKVYHDAMIRFANSQQISEKLIERSIKVITKKVDTAQKKQSDIALVVFNTLYYDRTEIATKKLYFPVEADGYLQNYIVKDSEGNVILSQIRNQHVRESFQPSFWEKQYPYGKRIREFDISFLASNVPPNGYKVFYLSPEQKPRLSKDLIVHENGMENSYLKVKINSNGTIDVLDKLSGAIYSGLHFFEDVESACGEYNHYTTTNPQIINNLCQQARLSIFENGPVCITFRIDIDMLLPEGLRDDIQGRSDKLVNCPITTYVTLATRSKRLDFTTIVENNVKDHRLRVRFPTGIFSDTVHAEGQFHIIERKIELPESDNWVEKPVPENVSQTFVSISDSRHGLTLINRGLPEYSAEKGENGVILSLTLLRSVGWIGREHFVTATYKIPTPDAQCLGTHKFEYSIYSHEGNWKEAKAWQIAHAFNASFEVAETTIHHGELPILLSLFSIEPKELVLTAFKKADDDDALIIRLYNISDKEVEGCLSVYKTIKKAEIVNFLEKTLTNIAISGKEITFPVRGYQIITLKIWI